MQNPPTYCDYIASLAGEHDNLHRTYHDRHYGFPLRNDNELFCRLMLEINQAGLSWTTILRKEEAFRAAYHDFDIAKVAAYRQRDVNRLLGDAGIIRNRLKVHAAVENARRLLQLQKEQGSFKAWLMHHHPLPVEEWTRLFKSTFVFTGGEIVREFLVSTGYLPGAHAESCPVYPRVVKARPPWLHTHTPRRKKPTVNVHKGAGDK